MAKCVMCGQDIWESAPYVTDGKITVCDKCAAANSLMRVVTRLENRGYDANIKSVYVRPIVVEAGLVDQTENADDPAALEAFHNTNGEPAEFLKD